MSAFDLVFAAFGLLLGLAIAEVLGGFARVLKLKRSAKPVRVGWLTPLLGLFVMLDLTSFWGTAFSMRDQMDASYLTLVVVLAIVGAYHLIASVIFPDEPEQWPDFDEWYDKQNRLVIAGLLALNIVVTVAHGILDELRPIPEAADGPAGALGVAFYLGGALSLFALLVALLFVHNRRWNVAMLVALNLILLSTSILEDYV
ncbi:MULTISPECIES: hypothetical protein [Sphingobium]|jgi:hypothetical protein|uniref:hypothetical protein n=1 Tax=Sphingobium TaxID=165695 RepID=UPI000DBB47AB|nr:MULTISPECIES: hypothetical protein [Sphingobium]KAA9013447.1 hypothetical protein F4U94_16625 [Sphingobium limneticum]MBU0933658.1 hypothetical protein [Alphaproteobacteria bacterium]BBD00357.1 hypothetical protein YGS_C1P1612 [Sphingobium sp. YG1]